MTQFQEWKDRHDRVEGELRRFWGILQSFIERSTLTTQEAELLNDPIETIVFLYGKLNPMPESKGPFPS